MFPVLVGTVPSHIKVNLIVFKLMVRIDFTVLVDFEKKKRFGNLSMMELNKCSLTSAYYVT